MASIIADDKALLVVPQEMQYITSIIKVLRYENDDYINLPLDGASWTGPNWTGLGTASDCAGRAGLVRNRREERDGTGVDRTGGTGPDWTGRAGRHWT